MRCVLLFFLPLVLAACQPPVPKLAGSGMDMFAPTAIRLHPLTRFVMPAAPTTAPATAPATQPARPQNAMLEARLEFSDQFSDPTKGAGTLVLQLFDQSPLVHKGALLQSWTLPLTTPQEQADHWDRTTRTYVFKLPLEKPLPGGRDKLLLTAALTLPNTQVLTVEMAVPAK
jgi:hypothetical protein